MFRNPRQVERFVDICKRGTVFLVLAASICLLSYSFAEAKKPPKPPDPGPYTFVDLLGVPGDALQSDAMCLTDRDNDGNIQIAGTSHEYSGGTVTPTVAHWVVDSAGEFPGYPVDRGLPLFAAAAYAVAINSDGTILGQTSKAVTSGFTPGYVDVPGLDYQELPVPPEAYDSNALGMNEVGEIVGFYRLDGGLIATALWLVQPDGTIGSPTTLDDNSDGEFFFPHDINNFQVMAGTYGAWPVIAWFEDGSLQIVTLDSSFAFEYAHVHALNDYPHDDPGLTVVGAHRFDENGNPIYQRGYAWRPNDSAIPTTLIGSFGGRSSLALDVNTAGQIVGWADTRKNDERAFIYEAGQLKDLNSLVDVGPELREASAINNDGDIVGVLKYGRPVLEVHGFLLRAAD